MNPDPNTTNHIRAGFDPVTASKKGLCPGGRIPIRTKDGALQCVGHHYTSASGTMVSGKLVGQGYTGPTNLMGCADSTCSSEPLPAPAGPSRGFPL